MSCQRGNYCINDNKIRCMFGVINCPFDDMESQLPVVSNIMIYILFGMLFFIFKKTVNKFSSNIRKFI
jgi:hypothetical protein